MTEAEKTHQEVWDEIYRGRPGKTNGQPGKIVAQHAAEMTPGRALELGCGKGDDAVWLATQGWQVTAVDLSDLALAHGRENAEAAGVADSVTFERHDLAETFPDGQFDLVTSCFMQSPVTFPRAEVLRRATEAVAPGGHLLIIEHGSGAPWSAMAQDTEFPKLEETLSGLELAPEAWQQLRVEAAERTAHGPEGQTAQVLDNVILLRRL
ncbi:class I SAM-dependent methyltransferase [Devosia sp.]|uniref:class I SAM-dependent methyltransferase n=1 Tax=Devosia sp. TaxID=1871048 RepID=UPI003A8E5E21